MPSDKEKQIVVGLNKSIEELEQRFARGRDRDYIVQQITTVLVNELKPIFEQLNQTTKEAVVQYVEGIKRLKIEAPLVNVNVPDVKVPEIKSPNVIIPEMKVPDIHIPEIKIPEIKIPEFKTDKLELAIKRALQGVRIEPQITVQSPEIVMPKAEPVKFPDTMRLSGVDRDKPMPVLLVDINGKPYIAKPTSISGGGGGGGGVGALKKDSDGNLQVNVKGTSSYMISDKDDDASPNYFGFVDENGKWYILKEIVSAGADAYRYAKGSSAYTTAWTGRAELTYDYYYNVF